MTKIDRLFIFGILCGITLFVVAMILTHIAIVGESTWALNTASVVCSAMFGSCLYNLIKTAIEKPEDQPE